MENYFQFIAETIFFKGLPDAHIQALLNISREKKFAKGEMIFLRG
ncbi:MAG: hypothetical protein R2861_12540 [Desulfobacterales bacterium]